MVDATGKAMIAGTEVLAALAARNDGKAEGWFALREMLGFEPGGAASG